MHAETLERMTMTKKTDENEKERKELKLIMTLGFILGGIIGFFQGVIAIFV